MKKTVDPRQNWLFDTSLARFSELACRRLAEDWPGIFRTCILELMPVEEIGAHFSEVMGRPTKELYSACGLLLLLELNDWTVEDAADAYMFDARVQFSLNLGADHQSMSTRTVERYQKLFRDDEWGHDVMTRVTTRLVELLDVQIDKLRLDSTHIFSNMATFGRTRLMIAVTRRFLIQVKRHNPDSYAALADDLRSRYEKNNWTFGKGSKGGLSGEVVAADMHALIAAYEDDESINTRTTFKDLVCVFSQQCELLEDKIVIRKHTGGDVMQNPSDPDATYDAKKGQGYQVQTAETCSDDNDTQLIVSAIPETACEHDQNAVEKVLDDLQSNGMEPSDLVADAGYGGDDNFCDCRDRGVKLTSPVIQGKLKEGRIELGAFELDSSNCITSCPVGVAPERAWFNDDKDCGAAVFAAQHCENCPLLERCQARINGSNYYIFYKGRALRIAERKRDMETPETRALYAKRSGIEATYSTGKRTVGLGRLRVRGRPAVFTAILLKITGLNILRAAGNAKIRRLVEEKLAQHMIFQLKTQLHDLLGTLIAGWPILRATCPETFEMRDPQI